MHQYKPSNVPTLSPYSTVRNAKNSIKFYAKKIMEPTNGFQGDRFCTITNIDGDEWLFATKIKE